MKPIIALLTDFGDDIYVACMKAVILRINPEAIVLDVTHRIPAFDIRAGAYLAEAFAPELPESSALIAVVDPGVGAGRKCIAVRAAGRYLIGPDNGVLTPAALRLGIEEAREISSSIAMAGRVSPTFHGRDVFAPAAAWLTKGMEFREIGPRLEKLHPAPYSSKVSETEATGEVVYIDAFGNLATSIRAEDVKWLQPGMPVEVQLGERSFKLRFVRTFGELRRGELGLISNSFRFLEVVAREASAASLTASSTGLRVKLTLA